LKVVGLDESAAGFQVLGVDLGDHLGRQREQIVVALELARRRGEALSAEVPLERR